MKLSVIIPAYKDPDLQRTIDSLLSMSELGNELEVIAVLNGYWPNPALKADPRVKQLHLGTNEGMREGINKGVAMSRGEFIMRTDAHCVFAQGYDKTLTSRFRDDWIVYPKRFYLDTDKWEVMDKQPNIYNKLVIDESRHKFSGVEWKSREKGREDKVIDESMAMQGSVWIMKRSWWDKVIQRLDSDIYGTHYGDSHEMVFKTWKAGGRLMVNKGTWHAHKHRDFPRTHNYGEKEARPGWDNAIKLWGDYYFNTIKPLWNI